MVSETRHKKVLVLGGGQQGSIIAEDLSLNALVTVADLKPPTNKLKNGIKYVYFDAKDVEGSYRSMLSHFWKSFDVVVSALPSHVGGPCVLLAAECGVHYVDLSYTTDDLEKYNEMALFNDCTIIRDCGFAPGLPNLVVGNYVALHKNKKFHMAM
jgi:saccharopine dehydrogenase-like NADP-dependent oxidoreductase